MADIAKAILAYVTALSRGVAPGDEDPLPDLRLALSRQVAQHCASEIDHLRARVKSHPEVAVSHAALIKRYHDELLAWRGALMDCNAHWPAKRVSQSPAAFLNDFAPLAEALMARIRWEEEDFYPTVFGRARSHA